MSDKHVITMFADKRISDLNREEISRIEVHNGECAECLKTYKAASVGETLLKARAAAEAEPSPFFHTRVMAAIKEKRREADIPVFLRLWRSAAAVLASMAAIIVVLFILTFYSFELKPQTEPSELSADRGGLPTENILFDQGYDLDYNAVSDGQMMSIMFDSENDYGLDQ